MGGHLALFLPQAERAIIGLRGPVGDGRLIVMFNRRKNLPRGCIMSRPCFRKLSDRAARQLGPERASWPLITKRVRSGNKLPIYDDTRANQNLKAVLGKPRVVSEDRYSWAESADAPRTR